MLQNTKFYNVIHPMIGCSQNYDLSIYPFHQSFLSCINKYMRDRNKKLSALELLHEVVTFTELGRIYDCLYKYEESTEFLKMYHDFLQKVIFKESDLSELVFQTKPSIRIQIPGSNPTIFHADKQFSHGEDTITCWVPLTKVSKTSSLQIVSYTDSVPFLRDLELGKLTIAEFSKGLKRISNPVLSGIGNVFIFGANWAHGTVVNKNKRTRISFDFRISYCNAKLGTKGQAGYYTKAESLKYEKSVYEEKEKNSISQLAIVYVFSNNFWTQYISTSNQRLICKEMARLQNINIVAEYNEFAQVSYSPVLLALCQQKHPLGIKIIIVFSVVCLPVETSHRKQIYNAVISHEIEIWFANEQLIFPTKATIEEVENMWQRFTSLQNINYV